MTAGTTIVKEVNDIRTGWRELWYAMADGDAAQYRIIKALDVSEFWTLFDQWKIRIDIKMQGAKRGQLKK